MFLILSQTAFAIPAYAQASCCRGTVQTRCWVSARHLKSQAWPSPVSPLQQFLCEAMEKTESLPRAARIDYMVFASPCTGWWAGLLHLWINELLANSEVGSYTDSITTINLTLLDPICIARVYFKVVKLLQSCRACLTFKARNGT